MLAFSTVVSESDRCVIASTSPRWTEGLFESDILFTSLSEESIRTGTSLTKSPGSVGFKTRFTDGDGIPGVVPSKLIAEATTTTVAGSPKLIQRESVGISWQIPLFLREAMNIEIETGEQAPERVSRVSARYCGSAGASPSHVILKSAEPQSSGHNALSGCMVDA